MLPNYSTLSSSVDKYAKSDAILRQKMANE
jgi:hypothetical protein